MRQSKTIAVVSPSGICSAERLNVGISLIESWGHQVVRSPNLNQKHLFFAGTLEQRLSDLNWALERIDVDIIWFARGGYGTSHLLSKLDPSSFKGKVIIGFSDATALLSSFADRVSATFVHGPVLHSIADHCDDKTKRAVKTYLETEELNPLTGRLVTSLNGDFTAPLVGGNLCVLASLVGTPWQIDFNGKIALLEDVGEAPYKIHRMIRQLKQAGCFEGVMGIAFGELTGSQPPRDSHWTLDDCLIDAFNQPELPIIRHLPVGHGASNLPWVCGAYYRYSPTGLYVD